MTIDKIKEVLADHLDMDTAGITSETTFDDLGIDSLETVEIMRELEDEFAIELSVADVGNKVGSPVEDIDSKKE